MLCSPSGEISVTMRGYKVQPKYEAVAILANSRRIIAIILNDAFTSLLFARGTSPGASRVKGSVHELPEGSVGRPDLEPRVRSGRPYVSYVPLLSGGPRGFCIRYIGVRALAPGMGIKPRPQ